MEKEKVLNHWRKGERGPERVRIGVSRQRATERGTAAKGNPATNRATCAFIGLSVVHVSVVIIARIVMSVRRTTTRRSTTVTCTRTSRLDRNLRDRRGKVRAVGYVRIGKVPEHASMATRASTSTTMLQPLQHLPAVVDVKIRVGLRVINNQVRNPPPQHRALRRPVLLLPPLDGCRDDYWRLERYPDFGRALPPVVGGMRDPACEVGRECLCRWGAVP